MITEETRHGKPPRQMVRKPTMLRAHLTAALPILLAAALIGFFYLGLYLVRHYRLPIGWDTPRYLFQANFVAERGLAGIPDALPPPTKTLHARPGFAIVVLPLARLFAVSTFHLAAIVPVVCAVALALAAGAFVSFTLRHDPVRLALVALVVGLSSIVIRLMAPETYTDNLLGMALFLTAFVLVVSAVRDGRGTVAAMILLGVGGIVHPPSYGEVLALLAVVGLLYLPSSLAAWRAGRTQAFSTPTGRLAVIVGGAAALTAAGIYGLFRATPDTPKLTIDEVTKKLQQDVPLHWYPVTAPLAAVGVADLAHDAFGRRKVDRRTARLVLALLLSWSLVVCIGVALFFLGRNAPAHRLLALLLPLPMFLALGLMALGRSVRDALPRRWHWREVAGASVVAAGVIAVAAFGARQWYVNLPDRRGVEWLQVAKLESAATAAQYLDRARVPDSSPVVFVIDDTGPNPLSYVPEMAYMIRSVLPVDRISHAYVYVGDPERYLAGQPTHRAIPDTYDANEQRFWPTIQRLLPQHPVALLLNYYSPAYDRFVADHQELVVAPNVVALSGPRPLATVPAAPDPYRVQHFREIPLLGVGVFLVVLLLGLGWAAALLPHGVRSFEVLALAPAFGLGALSVGALVVDSLGVRLGGVGGLVPIIAMAAVGWLAATRRLRRDGLTVFSPR